MILTFFPMKKLRRNGKYLLLGAILLVGAMAMYHEMVASRAWASDSNPGVNLDVDGRRPLFDQKRRSQDPDYGEDSGAWRSSYTPQAWKPEYKGRANLHVFEDWCGSSTAELRKNLHFPLYAHSRTTVQKLAVSPQWTNYGLRIFGYLHPYANGEFVFALSSDDNSEFWLSTDDSPLNLQLLVWVGKTGKEWTAPGEFEKYASQVSRPVGLSSQRRYFFEVIHKQNDRGTDHVEVAWKLQDPSSMFKVIESPHISLYVDESAFVMSDVVHIPQTAASHQCITTERYSDTADMLREDPRDTLYQVPSINSKFLYGVLPDCTYQPSYTIKDFPLGRYQGLQFVHMSYVYPNDYTRLSHMESENTCFYPESRYYIKMFGFSRYMKLDRPSSQGKAKGVRDFGFQGMESVIYEENGFDNEAYQREKEARPDQAENHLLPDYGDDYDDYAQERRRQLFSFVTQETKRTKLNSTDTRLNKGMQQRRRYDHNDPQPQPEPEEPAVKRPLREKSHSQNQTDVKQKSPVQKVKQKKLKEKRRRVKQKGKPVQMALRPARTDPQSQPAVREQLKDKEQRGVPSEQLNPEHQSVTKVNQTTTLRYQSGGEANVTHSRLNQQGRDSRKRFREMEMEMESNMPLQRDAVEYDTGRGKRRSKWSDKKADKDKGERDTLWGPEGGFEDDDDEDRTPAPVFDTEVTWSQTFQVKPLDLQNLRSDWIDLRCNITGNLLLQSNDVLPVVQAFMDQLNKKHNQRFTLVRVVNIVKRVDGFQGNRYLMELEMKDANGQLLRLSHYIYSLIPYSRPRSRDFKRPKPELVLCNPVGFRWNPVATVHFIVPVKNQARWVLQLIADMEKLFRETGDTNFNLIIADYQSTDMDVKKALEKSTLPKYQYVKLGGNFERSAGLQAGIDLIHDEHSIVFLCDLHIHFPSSIIDTIRKHCVEGYMAFAPIVMRLDCGATPFDARGYWEVNGFGLMGIYKSDLVAVGGMNTREFKDRWGGEDWELLDRILQAGLEVERIYLRNFFHHYHSKRGMWNRRMSPSHR